MEETPGGPVPAGSSGPAECANHDAGRSSAATAARAAAQQARQPLAQGGERGRSPDAGAADAGAADAATGSNLPTLERGDVGNTAEAGLHRSSEPSSDTADSGQLTGSGPAGGDRAAPPAPEGAASSQPNSSEKAAPVDKAANFRKLVEMDKLAERARRKVGLCPLESAAVHHCCVFAFVADARPLRRRGVGR